MKQNLEKDETLLAEDLSYDTLTWDAMNASEASFARVWDNEDDAVYDAL
ncbi:MAG: hypothetical protein ABIG63_13320 [Chloroflexota bacterium]